jgi:uncharacterized protein (TIGR04255 family)
MHELTEVLCAFWFSPDNNEWDSTYFGKYFELIKEKGFVIKEEQRAVQFNLQIKPHDSGTGIKPESDYMEGEGRMIFRTEDKTNAIILSKNFISFHKLAPYNGWDSLINDLVTPYLKCYRSLGLGNDTLQVQSLYLNHFKIPLDQNLSDIFTFLPNLVGFAPSSESNIIFQSQYNLNSNLQALIKLNGSINPNTNFKELVYECSSFAMKHSNITEDILIKDAHDNAKSIFKMTTKLI